MYTAPLLPKLLAQQTEERKPGFFKQGKFTLQWRAKVGSFPAPDVETLISAGELNAPWKWPVKSQQTASGEYETHNPHDFSEKLENRRKTVPLNGYIPASSIRGIVRDWAKQRPDLRQRMLDLLGSQDKQGNIKGGKIEFLDAWPVEPVEPSIDVANLQQDFQIFHPTKLQPQPHALYTLGDGKTPIEVVVAIRGIPHKAELIDVETVWEWVTQALNQHGVGSRTAAGYGTLNPDPDSTAAVTVSADRPGYITRIFDFELYSQGCYGAIHNQVELRPTHWRGWLRSWLLRFLLGVMSPDNALKTLADLMGSLGKGGSKATQGKIHLKVEPNKAFWKIKSSHTPYFYGWKGQLLLTGPEDLIRDVVVPVIKFAATVGGVGRGWRRPLHIYQMRKKDKKTQKYYHEPAFRGTHLILREGSESCLLPIDPSIWSSMYAEWSNKVQQYWGSRIVLLKLRSREEAFSMATCAVYAVPGPAKNPIGTKKKSEARRPNTSLAAAFSRAMESGQQLPASSYENHIRWIVSDPEKNSGKTRGSGMNLIYKSPHKFNIEVGGTAAHENGTHCSWVSIRRLQTEVTIHSPPCKTAETLDFSLNGGGECERLQTENDKNCYGIVCVFMGDNHPDRQRFVRDLADLPGAVHLWDLQLNKMPIIWLILSQYNCLAGILSFCKSLFGVTPILFANTDVSNILDS
jgi:CRISPR-associated protein Cmr6